MRSASVSRRVLAALVIGAMAVALNISVAAIIYQGPLTVFLDRAIALTLIGSTTMAVAGALLFTHRGAICQPQNAIAVILSIPAGNIVAGMTDPAPERSFATVAALVAGTAAVTGAVAWLLGRLRLGLMARFIPFPVLAGFLAATGYLLIMGGLGMSLGGPLHTSDIAILFEPGNPIRWLPWAFAALAIVALTRLLRQPLVFPLGLLVAAVAFYGAVETLGPTLDGARQAGWLLGRFEGVAFLPALRQGQPLSVDGWALLAQVPNVFAAVGLSIVAAVMSASSLEVAVGIRIDPDRDLRVVGVANVVSALGGGPVGYHSLSLTPLAHDLGVDGRSGGLIVAGACALALTVGAPVISTLPVGLFAAGVIVIGLNLLLGPLIDQRRNLPAADYAVVLMILAATAAFGFLWGVAVGLLAAALFFVMTFARIEVVRLATTGARLRSRLERPTAEQARLAVLGRLTSIYCLEGYIFFGTAHRLVSRIEAALGSDPRPRFVLIDFRRVSGLDTSAAQALVRLDAACRQADVELYLTGLAGAGARLIRGQRTIAGDTEPCMVDRLEQALEMVEERLLADDPATGADMPGFLEELRSLHPGVDFERYFRFVSAPAGAEVIAQGAVSDSILVLRSGALRTEVTVENHAPVTVARCLPGAMVGEIGLYAGTPRTARVIAEQPSEFMRIDAAALERMALEQPALLADLHRMVAATLARRLERTTALLADAELFTG